VGVADPARDDLAMLMQCAPTPCCSMGTAPTPWASCPWQGDSDSGSGGW